MYKIDNRPKKSNRGFFIALGIVLGIFLTIAVIMIYDGYKNQIINSADQIKQFAIKQIPKDSPILQNTQEPITTQPVTTTPKAPEITSRNIALQIHNLINQKRANGGLYALGWDDNLAQIAQAHSNDMMKNNYFDHNDLQGNDPSFRLNCSNPRENIGWTTDYATDQVPQIIVSDWMGSATHEHNILNSVSTIEGIGVTINDKHVIITEDFC